MYVIARLHTYTETKTHTMRGSKGQQCVSGLIILKDMPAKWTAHRCILGRQAVTDLSAAVCHSLDTDTDTHCHRSSALVIISALSVRKVL